MGTIAQKLTYLEDTKTAIGNAIAAKGGSVTGKTFRRISDGFEMGGEIYLGKAWYIGGKKLDEPIDELPEHFEEIDIQME